MSQRPTHLRPQVASPPAARPAVLFRPAHGPVARKAPRELGDAHRNGNPSDLRKKTWDERNIISLYIYIYLTDNLSIYIHLKTFHLSILLGKTKAKKNILRNQRDYKQVAYNHKHQNTTKPMGSMYGFI